MKKTVIYVRVSTQEQANNGTSIEIQLEKLRQYAKLNDLKITNEYIDAGISGAKYERPELDKLKANIKKIDIVLIYKLDRLSRSMKDTMVLIEDLFKPNNVDLISLSENFDTRTPIGMATVGMLSTFAQLERETIKERMINGKIQSVKNGNYINNAPIGYIKENGKLKKDPKNSKLVEYIFKRLLDGESTAQVARELEIKNIPSTITKKWYPLTVIRMAKNPAYIGDTLLMKTPIKNTHEPYITRKEYNKINELIESRKSKRSTATNNSFTALFRGVLKCKKCDKMLSVNRQPRSYGYVMSYRCINCKREKQYSPSILEKDIENMLLNFIENNKMLITPKEHKIKIKDFSKDLKAIEKKENKIKKAWFNDLITDDDFGKFQKEINLVKNKIIKEKEQQEKILISKEDINKTKEFITTIQDLWKVLNYEEKRQILLKTVKEIEIKDRDFLFVKFRITL